MKVKNGESKSGWVNNEEWKSGRKVITCVVKKCQVACNEPCVTSIK